MTKTTLENLIHRYEREYDKLYAARSTGTDEDLAAFDKLLEIFPDVIHDFNNARFDILSSDRECAAFAIAFRGMMAEALNR